MTFWIAREDYDAAYGTMSVTAVASAGGVGGITKGDIRTF